MIYTGLNNTGEVEAIYGHLNGVKSEVSEVYGSIGYNDPIFYSRKTLTGTSPLTFKALGQPLKDYHIFGETVQNGTPSPDYPVDVQGVGEKTENLLDMYSAEITNGQHLDPDGSIITRDSYFCTTGYIQIKPNTYYTINITNSGEGSRSCCFYDDNKNFISSFNASYNADKYTALSPENASFIRCSLLSIVMYPQYKDAYMLTEGEEPPAQYIPYGYKIPVTIGNTTTPIYIGSDPLYRVGEYADEIDFANQQIIRRVKKLVLDGTENWAQISSTTIFWIFAPSQKSWNANTVCIAANGYKAIKSIYGAVDPNKLKANEISCRLGSTYINDPRYTTVESFKDYLAERYSSGTPIILYYPFNTQTTSAITVPQLTAAVGDNTLTVDTTVKPSAVSITGHVKPIGYGQLLDVNDVDIQDSTGEPVYIQG